MGLSGPDSIGPGDKPNSLLTAKPINKRSLAYNGFKISSKKYIMGLRLSINYSSSCIASS